MRILLAGASGAIGRPLTRRLLEAGHEVIGLARSEAGAARIRAAGAGARIADGLDGAAISRAVAEARPEVVIHQMTAIPARINPRKVVRELAPTSRLRREATRHLAEAARRAGARRMISQSIAFAYRPEGPPLAREEEPLYLDAHPSVRPLVEAVAELERATLESEGLEGVVLRYGFFYGPGTVYARDGVFAQDVMKRRVPIVGDGGGVFSFIHLDDAAAATVKALGAPPGRYNIVDDDPARIAAWLPLYAGLLGAPPPMRVPRFVGRLAAGRYGVHVMTRQRGASNAAAKSSLGWSPGIPSWREGFRAELSAER